MADARGFTRLLCGSACVRQPGAGDDEAIAALAGAQHGVAARRQLLELGVTHDAIDHRLTTGRLLPLFPGGAHAAYAVGHEAVPLAGHALAATITVGLPAAASHWTALALHGLLDRPRPLIHVTSPRERRPRRGLFIHRAVLPQDEVALIDGIPVTSLSRTLLDLSRSCEQRSLRTLLKRAEFEGLLHVAEVVAILDRYPRRRGRRTLARVMDGVAVRAGRTQSPLEDDFVEFCAARDIPLPELNQALQAGGRTRVVDCLWRDARLAVELDGRDAHARELAFEEDRRRDRALTAAGWRPVRVTSAQLRLEADDLEADLRGLLGLRRA